MDLLWVQEWNLGHELLDAHVNGGGGLLQQAIDLDLVDIVGFRQGERSDQTESQQGQGIEHRADAVDAVEDTEGLNQSFTVMHIAQLGLS